MKHFIWIALIIILGSCTKDSESDCNNGKKDGTETGTDCGGSCDPCPTCSDGIKNQDEVQIDCGGTCNPCDIEYPETGTYGLNLLNGIDTLFLPGNGNSFKAIIPEGSSLKMELNLISGIPWGYSVGNSVGWTISTYSNGTQIFEAINGGTVDLNIVKWIGSGSGTILIKYFENDTSITKQKVLIWQ